MNINHLLYSFLMAITYPIILTGQNLPTDNNYILSVTPLDPTASVIINSNGVSVESGARTHTALQYYDGLGRPNELVSKGVTPAQTDLVQLTEYNGLHCATQQWLPVSANTNWQYLDAASVQSQAQNDYGDDRPYVETLYEYSTLERTIGAKQPGQSYSSHPASNTYSFNTASENVRIYTVHDDGKLSTSGTNYSAHMLHKTTAADEDGKSVITYTDKLGRKIAEKRAGSMTYYVYDKLNRLRFVLPHIPTNKLNNGDYPLTNSILKAAAYCYKYDDRGNMIYKRLPGSSEQYMVYDQLGQLVLKQDGNQRQTNKWTMFAYDSIGRNLYTAEIVLPENHSYYVTYFSDKWQVEHYANNQSNALPGIGYASTILGNSNLKLLIVSYYDNYDYLGNIPSRPIRQSLQFMQKSGYGTPHTNATGRLTGTRVYNLSETGFTATAYYYDDKGRVVQSRSIRNTRESPVTESRKYKFDNSIEKQLTEHGTGEDIVSERYRYTFDHAGRVKNTYYKLNSNTEKTLCKFSYDNIGRLVQKLLYINHDTITYTYDMRNMLTGSYNKHFSELLYYGGNHILFVNDCYNGNIAAARFTHAGWTPSTYVYTYDGKNRLTESRKLCTTHTEPSEWFNYDTRGNISILQRYDSTRLIDDLTFSYQTNGNRLLSVRDDGNDANMYQVTEYLDNHTATSIHTDMSYDSNGNLIADADRGISCISYNILNLPDTIQFVNGNQIVNLYDASGRKYKSIVYTLIPTATTPYSEIVHYTLNDKNVDYLVTDYEGSIEKRSYLHAASTQRIYNSTGYYMDGAYYYYLKDHLGNICAVVNATADTLVQKTLYYASGVPMAQSTGRDAQPYLYNGKEFIEAHGLNEYDSQARWYYSPIMRTTTMDLLAEKYYHISPYAWCGNNPTKFVDPDGRHIWEFDANGNLVHRIDDYIQDALRINGNQISFEYGSITGIDQDDYQTMFSFENEDVAANSFKFMADNSGVEYALVNGSNKSIMVTQHAKGEVNIGRIVNSVANDDNKITSIIHNHPKDSPPSGFGYNETGGDKYALQQYEDRLGYKIEAYVYQPEKSRLWLYTSSTKNDVGYKWGYIYPIVGNISSHTPSLMYRIKNFLGIRK